MLISWDLPSGNRLHDYGTSQFLMRKQYISMAIFNRHVDFPGGMNYDLMALLQNTAMHT